MKKFKEGVIQEVSSKKVDKPILEKIVSKKDNKYNIDLKYIKKQASI